MGGERILALAVITGQVDQLYWDMTKGTSLKKCPVVKPEQIAQEQEGLG